ncbi:UNVERIFIED_CONTAM: hypothetical protein RKD50_008199 [Streptomyces canus]
MPSLSPDGTRVAFKKRVLSRTDLWHEYVLDLRTLKEKSADPGCVLTCTPVKNPVHRNSTSTGSSSSRKPPDWWCHSLAYGPSSASSSW